MILSRLLAPDESRAITPDHVFQRTAVGAPSIAAGMQVTPDTALRLAQVTGMSADFWLGLQQDWDLWHALRSAEATAIARLKPLPRAG